MPVMVWRGHKLRLDPDGAELTMGQAKVIKRTTGLRLVAFNNAIQEMVDSKDVDAELMQVWLWLSLEQNGVKTDISDLDDVPMNELVDALASVVADEAPAEPDPTVTPGSGGQPSVFSSGSLTPTSNGGEPNTSSSLPTTAALAL